MSSCTRTHVSVLIKMFVSEYLWDIVVWVGVIHACDWVCVSVRAVWAESEGNLYRRRNLEHWFPKECLEKKLRSNGEHSLLRSSAPRPAMVGLRLLPAHSLSVFPYLPLSASLYSSVAMCS